MSDPRDALLTKIAALIEEHETSAGNAVVVGAYLTFWESSEPFDHDAVWEWDGLKFSPRRNIEIRARPRAEDVPVEGDG
jgi:hypothetical protein